MPILLCPNCSTSMREIRRNRVSLDICTTCRGVWLDRGELETLVNNVLAEHAARQAKESELQQRNRRDTDDDDEDVIGMVFDLLK